MEPNFQQWDIDNKQNEKNTWLRQVAVSSVKKNKTEKEREQACGQE